jgi:hypothetical protein
MRKRQKALARLLTDAGWRVEVEAGGLPTESDLPLELRHEAQRVYECLGGNLPTFPFRLGKWDLKVGDLRIELDEEAHFNRYRATTLQSPVYASLPTFPLTQYLQYCATEERRCCDHAGYGGYWSSGSTEKQFGLAGPKKDLTGAGAPRWKQRAFYDFGKDMAPLVLDLCVARLSVWDAITVRGRKSDVLNVLEKEPPGSAQALMELIEARAGRWP